VAFCARTDYAKNRKKTDAADSVPWFERTLLWGALGAVITLMSVYLGFVLRDICWFLVATWPFCVLVLVSCARIIRTQKHQHAWRIALIVVGALVSAQVLWQTSKISPAPNNQDAPTQLTNVLKTWLSDHQRQFTPLPSEVPETGKNGREGSKPNHAQQSGDLPKLTFSDSPIFTAKRKAHIEKEIDTFRLYLRDIGFDVSQQVFTIGVRPGKVTGMGYESPGAAFDGKIFLGEEMIDDPMALWAAYARYYFSITIGHVTTKEGMSDQLEMVYEIYFLESFTGKRLANDSEWNAVLWELRGQFGAKTMDKALLVGLQRREDAKHFKSANEYTANVVERGLEPHLNDVTELNSIERSFEEHGLMPPPSS
jgi:hypothetical protein